MIQLKFHGHACFQVTRGDVSLVFDPFFSGNPINKTKPEDVKCNYILVSHAHGDHLGDALDIAKRTGATIISTNEIAVVAGEKGCKSHGMHIGGKHPFEFGSVKITPAFHGSGIAGGHACGFLVDFYGKKIYFAGDTSLFGDMEYIGRSNIEYALLPIGDNYTMGIDDAVEAVGLLKPKTVIPMHYNTWPLIAQDPQVFKKLAEEKYNAKVIIINPGESIEI